jgi:hypothetical protein
LFEFPPFLKQSVAAKNGVEFPGVENAVLDELSEPVIILRAPDLKAD